MNGVKRGAAVVLAAALVFGTGAAGSAAADPVRSQPAAVVEAAPTNVSGCIACVGGAGRQTRKVSGPVYVNKKFVRHLTGTWAKAGSYNWSKSTTVGASLTSSIGVSAKSVSGSLGVTSSYTATWSVGGTIPANKKRYSKLTLRSDYKRYYVKTRTYVGKSYSSWKYSYLYSPVRGEQYLTVTYK